MSPSRVLFRSILVGFAIILVYSAGFLGKQGLDVEWVVSLILGVLGGVLSGYLAFSSPDD